MGVEPRRDGRRVARGAAILAWTALVVVLYHRGWGARFHPVFHVARPVALTLAIAAGAWGVGALIARWLRVPSGQAPGPLVLRLALGLAALSYLWLLLGAAGLLAPALAWAVLAGGLAVAALVAHREGLPRGDGTGAPALPASAWIPAVLVVLALACALPMALAPPASTDEVTYHLTVPRWYVEAGRIFTVPRFAHAAFPFQVEMLYAWALLLGSPVAAKLLHLLMGLAAAWAVARATRREGAGPWAAAVLLTTPAFLLVASWAWVDAATTLYVVVGCLLLARLREELTVRAALAAGLVWGMALGTKYTAALYLVAALPIFLWPSRGRPLEPRTIGRAAVACLVAGALVLPYLARNAIAFGNPTHPIGAGTWGPPLEGDHALMYSVRGSRETILERARGLLHYSLWDDRADGTIGFLYLLAAVVLAMVPLSSVARRCHVAGVVTVALLSMGFGGSVRYQLPGLALLAVAAGEWLAGWWEAAGGKRFLAGALLLTAGASNLWLVAWHDRELFDPLRVALGYEGEAAYLRRMEKAYPLVEILDAEPGPVKVLAVSCERLFWLSRPVVTSGPLDVPPARDFVRGAGSPGEVEGRLAAAGLTHVLVDWAAFEHDVAQGPLRAAWSEAELALFRETVAGLPLQAANGRIELRRVLR